MCITDERPQLSLDSLHRSFRGGKLEKGVKDHTKLTEMTGNFSTPALLLSVTKLITNWANLTLSGRKSANSSLASSLKVGADLVNFFRCPPNGRLV